MGIRLYPCTKNPRSLERLARVCPGTSKLVPLKKQLEQYFLQLRDGVTVTEDDGTEWPVDAGFEFYSLFSGSDVASYETFHLFGWGKFDLDLIPAGADYVHGSTTDPKVMRRLLMSSCWDDLPYNPGDPSLEEVIKLSEGFWWG